MARVPYLEQSDLKDEDKDLLNRRINLYRGLVNSPGVARAFGKLGGYIRFKSPLDPRLRELAILQVGYMTRCEYEYSHHVKIGMEFGVSEQDIRDLIAYNEGYAHGLDGLSAMVVRGAKEMTDEMKMSDEAFSYLQDQLGNECLTDLTVTIGFYSAVVRILNTLEIDVEDDYMPYLEQFPLPQD